jgi:hypothetical protein
MPEFFDGFLLFLTKREEEREKRRIMTKPHLLHQLLLPCKTSF